MPKRRCVDTRKKVFDCYRIVANGYTKINWSLAFQILVFFIHLAVILDVFFRKAIGSAISRNLDTQLILAGLRRAIENRNPPPGCIHHSDRGAQYASGDYVKELEFYQFQISMSRKENQLDNAYAESFIKILKSEEVHLWEYHTLEYVYNRKRLYSSLGYRPPCEYEFLPKSTLKPLSKHSDQGDLICAVLGSHLNKNVGEMIWRHQHGIPKR